MDYNFIEIGTSDFGTLIEQANDETIGLSIEPISTYLNRLPNKKNVTKVNCAISDKDGKVNVYYVPPEDINKYHLPSWLKGCNSIINPHPSTQKVLEEKNLLDILKTFEIDCYCWKTLVEKYKISSVDFLKIDTEGHDCYILNNIFDSNLNIFPKRIKFENNILSNKDLVKKTLDKLIDLGYKVTNGGEDVVLDYTK
jgi:FkbM family methyltransferase